MCVCNIHMYSIYVYISLIIYISISTASKDEFNEIANSFKGDYN